MKIRTGFVSNSSSQSFIIRGVIVSDKELEALGCNKDGHYGWGNKNGLSVHSTRNVFGGGDKGEYVVGLRICEMQDGEVVSLPVNPDDTKVIEFLTKASVNVEGRPLQWHLQFISNDNY